MGDLLWKNDPFRVKHSRKVWGKVDPPPLSRYASYDSARYFERSFDSFNKWQSPVFPYYVLDTEPGEYMSLEDQREEGANRLTELGLFEFMLRPSLREGEVSSEVYKVNLAGMVQDKATGAYSFPDQAVVAGIRTLLETASGTPIQRLLAEQDALIPTDTQQELPRPKIPGTTASVATPAAHPPLPPRRHRIPTRPE